MITTTEMKRSLNDLTSSAVFEKALGLIHSTINPFQMVTTQQDSDSFSNFFDENNSMSHPPSPTIKMEPISPLHNNDNHQTPTSKQSTLHHNEPLVTVTEISPRAISSAVRQKHQKYHMLKQNDSSTLRREKFNEIRYQNEMLKLKKEQHRLEMQILYERLANEKRQGDLLKFEIKKKKIECALLQKGQVNIIDEADEL